MRARPSIVLALALVAVPLTAAPVVAADAVTVTFAQGTLTVRTTAKSEEIQVQPAGESVRITIDRKRADIPPQADTKVGSVRLVAGKGKDTFVIDPSRGDLPPVVALGQAGKDTYVVNADMRGLVRIIDDLKTSAATLDLSRSDVPLKVDLGKTGSSQKVTPDLRLQVRARIRLLVAGSGDDRLTGRDLNETFTGGFGADTFVVKGDRLGRDRITDFEEDVDTLDLGAGLSARTGLGTSVLTIWDGATDVGTITATDDHLWQTADLS